MELFRFEFEFGWMNPLGYAKPFGFIKPGKKKYGINQDDDD